MHERRIIHRDLKPANILTFSDGLLKLGDLGLGRYMSNETLKAFSQVGTPLYMSPEVILNNGYDFKSDVWSLGCVIYELVTFKSPFRTDDKSFHNLYMQIMKGDYPKITDENYGEFIKDLIQKMLKVNPEERISLEDVIKACELILKQQDNKPKIDPFIVMEDIIEKLRLLNYEENYCLKYGRDKITKFYFACNSFGTFNKTITANLNGINTLNTGNIDQFANFYEISYWLINLTKKVNKLII